nr:TPA_asm: m102.2 sORF 1 [Murid betaherpesvirus 1]DBA08045.1 TPA_asm: m102.2 sORF 1 [Murid betaherpesvirus 1]
MAWFSSGRKA